MTDRDIMRDFDLSEIAAPPGAEPVPDREPIGVLPHRGMHIVLPEQIAVWQAELDARKTRRNRGKGQALPAAEPAELDSEPLHPDLEKVLREQIAACRAEMENSARSKRARLPTKGRPTITVVAGNLTAIVDQAEDALMKANTDIYQRGTVLVRPAMVIIKIADGRGTTAQQLVALNHYAIAEGFSKAAHWQKMGEKGTLSDRLPAVGGANLRCAHRSLAASGFDGCHQLPDITRGWRDTRPTRVRSGKRPAVRSARLRVPSPGRPADHGQRQGSAAIAARADREVSVHR